MKHFQIFRTVTIKFCKKFNFTSFDQSRGIEYRSNVLFGWSNRNRIVIEPSSDFRIIFFIILIDRAKASIDRPKIWLIENTEFRISLRKFQNLNFHFMKQYSPNSNIIIITYSCIYLYIQQFITGFKKKKKWNMYLTL